MHITDTEERRFLQDKFETPEDTIQFTEEGKKAILAAVIRGEQYEAFLGKKYVGTKRFGLDGGESMIPALEAVIKYGGQLGVREIIYGMAHRGRLNVLANVMGKPYKVIFHEFSGGSANPDDVGGSGDVKYHLGTSTDREFDGINVHMSLTPNPSHLEAVNPVVLGKSRAQQAIRDDLKQHEQVLPVLLHGDAAFAGQGIVWECLGFSGVRGYNTGGCIHFVINNQIGFTTSPQFARSSPYPSDVAKGVQAPILHVNGDDPEAVTFACKLAIEYRQTFGRDIVIDMWCYRRFGHNEGDEPKFTQPLMYDEIRQHPKVSAIYSARLEEEGVIEKGFADGLIAEFTASSKGIRRGQGLQARPGRLVRWPLGGHEQAGRSGNRAPQRRDSDREEAVRQPRPDADDGARRPDDPQDAGPRDQGQGGHVLQGRRLRLGDRRGARFREPRDRRLRACACRARIRVAVPSASATPCGSTRRTSTNTFR